MMTKVRYKAYLSEFIDNLEQENFYDAHESIEVIWFDRRFEKSDEVLLLKGFINSAVSFELKKRGKISQSKKVWKNYLKYRQLLYKINSPYKNEYYKISRYIDKLNNYK